MTSNPTPWIIGAVVAVILAVIVVLLVRRARYKKALQAKGWSFDPAPGLQAVWDHQAPPFGLGFTRKPDELVSGRTSAGIEFRVFEYDCSDGGPRFSGRLASLQLPYALPELFVSSGTPRAAVSWPTHDLIGGLTVQAADPQYARAALGGGVPSALQRLGQVTGGRIDLAVDGRQLVAVGAPKDPNELAAYLEALAPVAQAIAGNGLQAYAVEGPRPRFGFYGRPDWELGERDDSLIERWGLTRAGHNHRTEKIVLAPNDGLPFEAFEHHWQTTRVETSTDSNGRTTTRTVTENHSEDVFGIILPFGWPLLAVGGGLLDTGWGGQKVRFESEQFNDAFTVRTSDPRFASAVIHPRTMEYLLATAPPGFRIEGRGMRYFPREHATATIAQCADSAHGFFARVPSFVWQDLQVTPPRFRG